MTVLRLALATLRYQSRQYLAPGLAVVLGVAFVAATLTLAGTLTSSMRAAVAGQYAPYSAVVLPGSDEQIPAQIARTVAGIDGVEAVDATRTGHGVLADGSSVMVTTTSSVSPHPVLTGREPRARDEIALSETVAAGAQLEVGDTVPMVSASDEQAADRRAAVVGIVDVAGDPRFSGGIPAVFATPEGVTRLTGATGWEEIAVVGSGDEASATAVLRSGLEAKGANLTVRTATDHADAKVVEFTGGTDVIAMFLLAFAAVALFVSGIVIANTFSILLARRARETALLRAVGSTRAQVIRSSGVESLVIAVLASVAGVAVGIATAWALARTGWSLAGDDLPELVFTVPPRALVVPVVTGVVIVLIAALRPVLRSSRVAPLEALRPDAVLTVRSRSGRVRIALGVVLLVVGGIALIVGGLLGGSVAYLLLGVVGGLLSFTGVLLLGTVLVPWAVRAVGLLAARPFGSTGRLAIDNTVRNPARASATASALLVGVTLVTMTAVGAATARTTVTDFINGQYPVDVVVQGKHVPDATTAGLARVDGVVETAALAGSQATAILGGQTQPTTLVAVPDDLGDVVRSPGVMPQPVGDAVVLSADTAGSAGLSTGDPVILQGPDGRVRASVEVDGSYEGAWLVTPETLGGLDTSPTTSTVMLRIADDVDQQETVDEVKDIAAGLELGQVTGAAPVRAANMRALDTALVVVLVLLAISVVISLVGIANTLSLSVIERTRESALLRALGLTRAQLRGMLAIESVLLALVGVVIGTLLGTGYAFAGTKALLGETMTVVPTVPWTQLAAVAGAAVVAGLLASVLPARRAVRVPPAQALAVE